jgi:hypothetical protein
VDGVRELVRVMFDVDEVLRYLVTVDCLAVRRGGDHVLDADDRFVCGTLTPRRPYEGKAGAFLDGQADRQIDGRTGGRADGQANKFYL